MPQQDPDLHAASHKPHRPAAPLPPSPQQTSSQPGNRLTLQHTPASDTCHASHEAPTSHAFMHHICRPHCPSQIQTLQSHQEREHTRAIGGKPMRPATASAPTGVRKPSAITARTHAGASLKHPLFQAAPPPCSIGGAHQALPIETPGTL